MMNKINAKSIRSFFSNNAVVLILFIIIVFVGFMRPRFVGVSNITSIAVSTSIRFIVALGVSGCLITKGTDLSAGRVIGLGGCIAASLLQRPDYANKLFPWAGNYPIIGVFAVVLLVTVIIGFFNGVVISLFKVPPFIATLGMQQIIYGANLIYSKSQPIGALRNDYSYIATGGINIGSFKLPFLCIIAAIIGALMWFLYNKTKHGKYMYAIGGNETAAEVSGINTVIMKMKIYALAGFMYGVAGILLTARAGGASVGLGAGYELEAIAACTIGGVSTTGGVGKISGILIGVLVFELLKSSLQFMRINSNYQYIVQGIVIVTAVAFDIRKYIAKK